MGELARMGGDAVVTSACGTILSENDGQSMSALPRISDFDLLGYGKCVINFDAKVANRAFIFVWPNSNWTALRLPVRR
jgi:hypothetical protein